MRIKSLLHQLLGLEYTRVVDCAFVDDGLVIDVAPTWREPRCSSCGHTCPGDDRAKDRTWRHMDAAGMKLYLRYDTRRADCVRYGVTVEHLPWADVGVWFTRPFEDHVGDLAQRSDKTTVSSLMRIAWTNVGDIIQRVVKRHQRVDSLEGLTHIGVDELSYRKHHEYVTVVVDHIRQGVRDRGPSRRSSPSLRPRRGSSRSMWSRSISRTGGRPRALPADARGGSAGQLPRVVYSRRQRNSACLSWPRPPD